jgi:tryptophanyl-tRNA synthetase
MSASESQEQSAKTQARPRSLSGIKPTGTPHLGNYLGMIRPAIALQDGYDAYYFVADLHALTSEHDPAVIRRESLEVTAYFLAFGLDPARSVFYRQSDLPEVTELTWLLSCVTAMGLLDRAHAYKAAKDRGEGGSVVHGLFAYPVLMAADILMYGANVVPVGKDQVQHLEMTRDIAQRFNHIFGETFVIPEASVREEVATVPGLDGRKMSKSYDNTVQALLPTKQLKQRIMQIVTDSKSLEEPKDPTTCNVFALYSLFADEAERDELASRYRAGNFGYGHAKLALFEKVDAHMAPYREAYQRLIADPAYLEDVLADGARRARETSAPYLERARAACGFSARPPR